MQKRVEEREQRRIAVCSRDVRVTDRNILITGKVMTAVPAKRDDQIKQPEPVSG